MLYDGVAQIYKRPQPLQRTKHCSDRTQVITTNIKNMLYLIIDMYTNVKN